MAVLHVVTPAWAPNQIRFTVDCRLMMMGFRLVTNSEGCQTWTPEQGGSLPTTLQKRSEDTKQSPCMLDRTQSLNVAGTVCAVDIELMSPFCLQGPVNIKPCWQDVGREAICS